MVQGTPPSRGSWDHKPRRSKSLRGEIVKTLSGGSPASHFILPHFVLFQVVTIGKEQKGFQKRGIHDQGDFFQALGVVEASA